ncbi:MAG: penicillin-binding protein [Ignavibacteriales bacterium]|nr:penicillin-binding protein [Ignavibacteriales bacterium]
MISSRALILVGFLLLIFVALVAKLFSIQVAKHEYYSLVADRQQNKPLTVVAERGLIKDANGEVLSYTTDNISFFADTRMMNSKRIDSISAALSRVFNKPEEYYKKIIADGAGNVCLEKKIPMEKALELKKTVIEGLFQQEDFSRVYPYGNLASHVLGFVNRDMVGVEGIEKIYQEKLEGTDGYFNFERDVLGRIISVDENLSRAAVPGDQIILTINKTYQKILEEELANGMKKFGGESAVGIIMNPNTGEIYSLANSPDFDPANYENSTADARRDRAITDPFEPGSTMKSITLSILLDQNLVNEDEVIDVENGKYFIKNTPIMDTHPNSKLTVRGVLEQSSNVGMAKLSARVTDDVLYKYLRDFGFSNSTLIELPSESAGSLKKPSAFSGLTKPFLSFGYEIALTPLQLITAYCALINGGTLLQPYIVKKITDHTGKDLEVAETRKIRTVISKSTSDRIRNLMVGVVENGTGTAARLQNVLVGGKTGTAQRIVNNSYSSAHHNSSFIGFFPADNPKIVCLILVNAPRVGEYGGLVAAPVFHEVAKRMIETDLSIVPDKKNIERKQNLIDQLVADIKTTPKVKTTSFAEVADKHVTNISSRKFFSGNNSSMPNLMNQSVRDAIAQLNELGLKCKVSGTGKVVWQSLEPGSNIVPGSECIIKCEPSIKKISMSVN